MLCFDGSFQIMEFHMINVFVTAQNGKARISKSRRQVKVTGTTLRMSPALNSVSDICLQLPILTCTLSSLVGLEPNQPRATDNPGRRVCCVKCSLVSVDHPF